MVRGGQSWYRSCRKEEAISIRSGFLERASDDAWARDVGPPLLSMGRGRYGELTGVLMHGVESVTDCMQTGKRMIK